MKSERYGIGICVKRWRMVLLLLFTFHFSSLISIAQSKLDSVQHVREIVVVSRPAMREVVPSQKLNGEMLEKLNTHSVADALRYFSGIQIQPWGQAPGACGINSNSTRKIWKYE